MSWGNWGPIQRKERKVQGKETKSKRESALERSSDKISVVRFLISPKKKKVKIEVNKIMNPAFLLGTAFKIAYWDRKYHSGTICKGVSNVETSNALYGCDKEEIEKKDWKIKKDRISMKA